MLIGYARVSTFDQNLDLQEDALNKAGCERIFSDKIAGGTVNREGLSLAFEVLRKGDTLVVWRLDRLGRHLKKLIEFIETLDQKGIAFKSLTENIDTTSATGTFMLHLFGAFAEMERRVLKDRTRAGLDAAYARGRTGGRPRLVTDEKKKEIIDHHRKKVLLPNDICKLYNISRGTLYKYLREEGFSTPRKKLGK